MRTVKYESLSFRRVIQKKYCYRNLMLIVWVNLLCQNSAPMLKVFKLQGVATEGLHGERDVILDMQVERERCMPANLKTEDTW